MVRFLVIATILVSGCGVADIQVIDTDTDVDVDTFVEDTDVIDTDVIDTDVDTDSDTDTDTDPDTDTDTDSDTDTDTDTVEIDGDGDGWGIDDDCDDSDASVNPSAIEVYANGKDDDCDGTVDDPACPKCAGITGVLQSSGQDGSSTNPLYISKSGATTVSTKFEFYGKATNARIENCSETSDPAMVLAFTDTDTSKSGIGHGTINTTGRTGDYLWTCDFTSDQGGITVYIRTAAP